jgi:predicted GTPase
MATHQKLKTCDPDLTAMAASRSNSFILRKAVHTSPGLGYVYDACCDQVRLNSKINFVTQSANSRQPPECFVKTYNVGESPPLLELIDIHPELQLSIALEMIPANGVGALINYSRPIDKYTRFIRYSYYSRTEYISDDDFISLNRNRISMLDINATHVIVLVNWGIDAVVVLQLPHDDELIENIDRAIAELCDYLEKADASLSLSQDEIRYLEKIVHTEVFANTTNLSKIHSIVDFYRDIPRLKNDSFFHKPCNYNLYPIQYFFAINNAEQGTFNELEIESRNEIKHYLSRLSLDFKRLKKAMDQDYPYVEQHRKQQLYDIRSRWAELKQIYTSEIQRLRDLIIRIRRGESDQNVAHQTLSDYETKKMTNTMNEFTGHMNVMQETEHFIKDLLRKQFEYQNANDRGVKSDDDNIAIEHKLLEDTKLERIICSDDNLYKNKKSQWYVLYGQLLNEREQNPQLTLIYVDFTDGAYKLNDFMIFPVVQKNNHAEIPESVASSLQRTNTNESIKKHDNRDAPEATTTASSQRLRNDEIINILLIGESGVGKSTFINAFVNYLKFERLDQAQNNAVVLIPVSFIMATGDDFKEHSIKFGGMDTLSNEDHGNTGQSVTQHCKSYVFTLRDGDDSVKKLRIIDTPGIGDVRGSAQDDVNMQHILSYINNLTHLSAVCILMKPNTSRLNVFFRSCFVQLFDLLGENARDKIIFCFTNARSTFYTPGNTAPLLKQLLGSLPVTGIPFNKENTFCFDSESFRYLVAIQNGIEFKRDEREEYNDSWGKSSNEAKRFLHYIRTKMTPSLILSNLRSMKHTQLTICLLIRPLLETMRNTLRNIVLSNAGLRTVSIELCPIIVKGTTAICLKCPRQSREFGDFWITTDGLHVFHNKCRTCQCDPADHYPIDYELGYKLCQYPTSNSNREMTKMLDDLCEKSAEFAHFLFGMEDTSQNDLFLLGYKRMITEERAICKDKTSHKLNLNLVGQLDQLKTNYENMRKEMLTKKSQLQLSDIHDKIDGVNKYPMIQSQMTAVEQWQKFMLKYYEYEVPT